MTEQEWSTCNDPAAMLGFLQIGRKEFDRKGRLFTIAACSRLQHLLTDERSRRALEVAERYADAKADDAELDNAYREAFHADRTLHEDVRQNQAAKDWLPALASNCVVNIVGYPIALSLDERESDFKPWAGTAMQAARTLAGEAWATLSAGADWDEKTFLAEENRHQSSLLRCIFGNPFRPLTLEPSLLSDSVAKIAKAIYNERALTGCQCWVTLWKNAG
ncbi:hypothetical protein AYO40_04905 [Planctomycetaceae bacterium SCGC AG-212-D15]|nr:hypothetical protein AYO40_04905 [Planctomycetaceae bacterium SCGC AG-212-D15]